jgi:glutamate-1-semialdehyde 2,1-aminomutase
MTGFKNLHKALLNKGVYMGPSGYEVGFVSQAHTDEILGTASDLFIAALDEIMA